MLQVSKKKYIYTIDDDCFLAKAPDGASINALEQHIRNLLTPSTPFFFNTLYDPFAEGADFVRGYPFSWRQGAPTALSHGAAPGTYANRPYGSSGSSQQQHREDAVHATHMALTAVLAAPHAGASHRRLTLACRAVAEHPGLRRAHADGQAARAQHALCGRSHDHPQGVPRWPRPPERLPLFVHACMPQCTKEKRVGGMDTCSDVLYADAVVRHGTGAQQRGAELEEGVCAAGAAAQGSLYPMCGMNLAFNRELIGPAMYFGLMGDGQPLGRYDDMWAGWCSKVRARTPHAPAQIPNGLPSAGWWNNRPRWKACMRMRMHACKPPGRGLIGQSGYKCRSRRGDAVPNRSTAWHSRRASCWAVQHLLSQH